MTRVSVNLVISSLDGEIVLALALFSFLVIGFLLILLLRTMEREHQPKAREVPKLQMKMAVMMIKMRPCNL